MPKCDNYLPDNVTVNIQEAPDTITEVSIGGKWAFLLLEVFECFAYVNQFECQSRVISRLNIFDIPHHTSSPETVFFGQCAEIKWM